MPATSGTAVLTLPSDTEILMVREFDAPKALVYKAYTTPELVKRWWGGRRGEVHTAEIDLRVGGKWRYAMTAQGGFEVAFNGEYRELVPNEKVVHTEIYEAMQEAGYALVTCTFEETESGRTTLSMLTKRRLAGGARRDHRLRHGGRRPGGPGHPRGDRDRAQRGLERRAALGRASAAERPTPRRASARAGAAAIAAAMLIASPVAAVRGE